MCNLRSNREIRIAIYSFFLGIFTMLVIAMLMSLSSKTKSKRNKFRLSAEERVERVPAVCPVCPANKKACLICPSTPIGIPGDMKQFLDEHMVETREGPLVITRARMKSVSSYFLSLHSSERDMQISHRLATRGDWNDQLIRTVCHLMQRSAPLGAYFVDVGAYVGSLAFGVTMCGIKVAAFEPYRPTFRLLEESLAVNHFTHDQIQLYDLALGNATGKTCLAASNSDRSTARIYTGECADNEIDIDTLDHVLHGTNIWYLYMDTGGFEPGVLSGARSFLTGPNPPRYVHFKVSHRSFPKDTMGTKLDLAHTLEWLQQLGYALRDDTNEPIRNIDVFVRELGHDDGEVVAIYQHNVKIRIDI